MLEMLKILGNLQGLKWNGKFDGNPAQVNHMQFVAGNPAHLNAEFTAADGVKHTIKSTHPLSGGGADEIVFDDHAVDNDDVDIIVKPVLFPPGISVKVQFEFTDAGTSHTFSASAKR